MTVPTGYFYNQLPSPYCQPVMIDYVGVPLITNESYNNYDYPAYLTSPSSTIPVSLPTVVQMPAPLTPPHATPSISAEYLKNVKYTFETPTISNSQPKVRRNRAIPIVNPNTNEVVVVRESKMSPDAKEFVPSSKLN